jgi:YVTN family beta-propeller protein
VWVDGSAVPFGGRKQGALLAVLLLHANELVSSQHLIDELWGENPPARASHSLEVYVSQLRKLLQVDGRPQLLVTRRGGYLAELDPAQLDSHRFELLCEEGRRALAAGDPKTASARLRDALSLWRGEALAELDLEGSARVALDTLEELHLAAREDWIDSELALSRHTAVVGQLETLVQTHPYRERLSGQLMLALYRSGRQAEALDVYRQTRARLVEELGIEPSRELRELHQGILRQDTELTSSAASGPAATPSTGSGNRRALIGVLAVMLIVAAIAVPVAVLTGGSAPGLTGIGANAVGVIDARTGRIVGDVPVGMTPTRLAAGAGSVWVSSTDANTVVRIDAATLRPVDRIEVGNSPIGIAYAGGAVWVANSLDGTISRIDPTAGRVVQTIQVGSVPSELAAAEGSVWVANSGDGTLSQVAAATGRVVATVPTGVAPSDVAAGAGALWATAPAGNQVLRIDPNTHEATNAIGVGNGPGGLVFAAGALWVANTLDGTISRIDPLTRTVTATVFTGGGPSSLAYTEGALWISNEFARTVVRIDPETNAVDRTIGIRSPPEGAVPVDGRLWVAAGPSGDLHRGGTLNVLNAYVAFDTADPALAYVPSSWSILSMTNDGLTGFARVGGGAGTRIVPDLAASLPTPLAGGTVYTFHVRRGIRYSTGALVRPQDFRRAIERSLTLGSPGAGYYRGIVGAVRCLRGRGSCDLSAGILADGAADTVTFRLVEPDPEFFYKLALPFAYAIPAGTPRTKAARPLPATGPYRIAGYDPQRRLKLVRNPSFREWSHAAQPDGYPDTIVWQPQADPQAAVDAVERGRADVLLQGPPPDRLAEVQTRFAGQLHLNPAAETVHFFLNTRVPPFDDVRVRRAINLAIDRGRIVSLVGGPAYARLNCQLLPPAFPGYRPVCPYTLDPDPSGGWHAPDLATAKRLVALSGTAGTKVTVWVEQGSGSDLFVPVLLSTLRALDYRPSLKTVGSARYAAAVRDSRSRAQIGVYGWVFDYPTASNFMLPTLSCDAFRPDSATNTNESEFCDPQIDAQMKKALALEGVDLAAANRRWATIERRLLDQAPLVPTLSITWDVFVSKRVGNYKYNPQLHTLIDQLWVR